MKSILTISALGLIAYFGLGRFERSMIWPLDPAHVTPQQAGVDATEHLLTMQDGTKIVTWAAPPAPGKPTVLYFHGNAGNLAGRAWRFRWFIDQGYGLVAMSYRGSSGSGGKAVERNISSDAREIYDQIGTLTGAQNQSSMIYGESIGGAVGTALAAELQDDPQLSGLVLEAPFTAIPHMVRRSFPQFRPLMFALKNRFPTEERVRNIETPLLVIHGTDDRVIPFDMGQSVFATGASPNKTFIEIPGGGHDDTWRPFVVEKLDQLLMNAQVLISGE